eukprot:352598-Chlamydomonas_euryale.AAC.17
MAYCAYPRYLTLGLRPHPTQSVPRPWSFLLYEEVQGCWGIWRHGRSPNHGPTHFCASVLGRFTAQGQMEHILDVHCTQPRCIHHVCMHDTCNAHDSCDMRSRKAGRGLHLQPMWM